MRSFRHKALNEITVGGRYMGTPIEPLPVPKILDKIKNAEAGSLDQFQRLFFFYRLPSSADTLCLQVLAKAISLGELSVHAEFLSTPPPIDISLNGKGGERSRTVESPEHQGMKKWVKNFLEEKGLRCAEEVSKLDYKVDVGSLAKETFVECGDTEPRKIFEFLRHNLSIGILQYYSEEIVWFVPQATFPKFANSMTGDFLA